MLTMGSALARPVSGPCVLYSHLPDSWTGCVQASLKYRAPVAARRLVPVPEPVGTTVLLFLLVVFMGGVTPSKLGKEARRKISQQLA